MISNFQYHMPTKVLYGIDLLDNIDNYINGRKTLLVTSDGFVRRGVVDRLKSLSNDIIFVTTKVKSHPEFKDLKETYNEIHEHEFDVILALGGGSVLDASKFFSVYNEKKESQFVEDIIKGRKEKKDYQTIPIISVPTTAGTGSEITPWATIWDMGEKKKYSLHLPELFSEVAIYDASLSLTVPKDITIQTALDTLSHSLESIWNKNANEITINYAVTSAKIIIEYLPLLAKDLNNLQYREQIMKACMYASLAFSNTQTAIAHAMSYYITAHKKVPHGIACSFTLPFLIDNVINRYEHIDKALIEIFGELSSLKLRNMLSDLNVSMKWNDYDISKSEVLENIDSKRLANSLIKKDDLI